MIITFHVPESARPARFLARCALVIVSASALLICGSTSAQTETNRVYVDDSPLAWELFLRASDQEAENPGEAARLYQELLDLYPLKLIPRLESDADHLVAVRSRVHAALRSSPALFDRYRQIETTPASRMLAEGRLEALRLSRFLTEPALEATIRLAQDAFEHAQFERAYRLVIEAGEHPDLAGRRAAYRWLMLGVVANHLGEFEARDQAIAALDDAGDPDSRTAHGELMRLLQAGPGPEIEHGVHVLGDAPQALDDSIVENPIWSIGLDQSLFVRRFVDSAERSSSFRAGSSDYAKVNGDWLTVAPAIAGRAIYINEGQVIRALDRFSVREFWRQQIGDTGYIPVRNAQSVGDLNIIDIAGDRLVTVTGHGSGQMRLGTDRIVCLNRVTGESLWQVDLDRLGGSEEYEDLFPQGGVTIADDSVYLLARKITKQVLTSIYLIALNLSEADETKRVRWIRHIASSATMQGSENRPFSHLVVDRGEIFVATPIGAVACVDAVSGEPKWLRRLEVPLQLLVARPPWKMSMPVVTENRVIALGPDGREVFVLDRHTGNQLDRFRADRWGRPGPDYLLAGRELLFAVGQNITAVRLDALDFPVWTLNGNRPDLDGQQYEIRGRVQLAGDTLVVPDQRNLLLIDSETGAVNRSLDIPGAGNPLVNGAELFYATSDSLFAYVPLSVAEGMLREQMSTSPHTAAPALSLLRLASRAPTADHAVDLALDASDHAIAVLERIRGSSRYAEAHAELFASLLEVSGRAAEIAHEKGLRLHDRIAALAETDDQQIDGALARGDWLATKASHVDAAYLADAVDAYQHVLKSPALSFSPYELDGVARRAGDVAAERLAAILTEFGPAAHAGAAAEAIAAFAALGPQPSPDLLASTAARFPFAPASRAAIERAAEEYVLRDQPREGLASLKNLLATATDRESRRRALGAAYELSMNQGWPRTARFFLERAAALMLPDLPVQGSAVPVDRLLAQLPISARDVPRPALGPLSVADFEVGGAQERPLPSIDGRLVALSDALISPPRRFALFTAGGALKCARSEDLALVWEAPLATTSHPTLIACDDRTAVVEFADDGDRVQVYDLETGRLRWQTTPLQERLLQFRNGDVPRRHIQVSVNGERRSISPFDVLTFATTSGLIAIGRSGGMIHFSFDDPETEPLWAADHALSVVHHAAVHELAIVLAGEARTREARGETTGQVLLINPVNGEAFARSDFPADLTIRWLRVTPGGQAIVATDRFIRSIDLCNGSVLWENRVEHLVEEAERAWVLGDFVVVCDSATTIRSIRLDTGAPVENFQPRAALTWDPKLLIDLHGIGDRVLAHYMERLAWFDRDGVIDGQDQVTQERDYAHVAIGDSVVFALSHVRREPGFGSQRNRPSQQHWNVIYTFSDNGKLLTGTHEFPTGGLPPQVVWGIDGWLLISEETSTIALPAPTGGR